MSATTMAIKKIKSKTLVIQPQEGIGDFMFYLPHIHAIAQQTPEKKVVLLTHPKSQADILIQNDPYIERVLWAEIHPGKHDGILGTLRLARLLESYNFEIGWILCSRSLRYGLSCWLAGIKRIYGPGYRMQKYFLTSRKSLTLPEQKKHPIERANLLLRKRGIVLLDEKKALHIPSFYLEAIKKKFHSFPKPWTCLIIGASKPYKKWPLPHFAELAEKIYAHQKGTIFIIGGPMDKEEGYSLHIQLSEKGVNVHSVFKDLWDALSLIQLSNIMVGNETGLTHGAPLVGTKALVVLGGAQPPIHLYTQTEGIQANVSEGGFTNAENNLKEVQPLQVMEKLKELKWI